MIHVSFLQIEIAMQTLTVWILTLFLTFLAFPEKVDHPACSCIGMQLLTPATEVKKMDVVLEGKIIGLANFNFYDTLACYQGRQDLITMNKSIGSQYHQIYSMEVHYKFKTPNEMPDTILVASLKGGGMCEYVFELDKNYILYGYQWIERTVQFKQKAHKTKRIPLEIPLANVFITDICTLTQKTTPGELQILKRLKPGQ